MRLLAAVIILLNSATLFGQGAEFSFDKKNIKLTKTPEGEMVKFSYPFTNKGDQPLIISEIKVSCPCTKFQYPSEPIPPQGTGVIDVQFDTEGKIGYQDRKLEVFSNATKSPESLRFRIMVDNKAK